MPTLFLKEMHKLLYYCFDLEHHHLRTSLHFIRIKKINFII